MSSCPSIRNAREFFYWKAGHAFCRRMLRTCHRAPCGNWRSWASRSARRPWSRELLREQLWAAGVAASPLGKRLGAPLDRAGRVLVNRDLSIPERPEVFVIGDLATLKDEHDNPLPGVAPVAMQQGRFLAKTIARDLKQLPRQNFHYFDKGSLATIGRAAAVAQIGKLHISGYFA